MLKRRRPFLADINVTPFVDVMLVLLVIFMITAPLMQHGMDVQLPKESIAPIPIKDIPTITVKSNKKIFWKQEELANLMALTRKVKQYIGKDKDSSIYLRADKMLDYGFVMHVMATVKEAGVENIGMVTEP
ncbi:MAG: ExbD/TolR family protein [Nitrospinota bacterium]|nr:ExbD/TolR family protein [Nitrospinota bacterium]MEC8957291.1 ExbD/TolR family protein [Nitrospinota bacterium]MEC9019100.1 ExbD/TolR family protein [Nitrospinota bacterium]MEE3252998.1 ExbD/TolR family protein [Nitrospinota bacterium]